MALGRKPAIGVWPNLPKAEFCDEGARTIGHETTGNLNIAFVGKRAGCGAADGQTVIADVAAHESGLAVPF